MKIKRYIEFSIGEQIFRIPNAWELLTPEQYTHICFNVERQASGELSAGMVKVLYICDVMGWDRNKIKDEDSLCNLSVLADQITFIYNIVYSDEVTDSLSADERAFFQKIVPERSNSAIARYLTRQNYSFVLDACFCAQLVPTVIIDGTQYDGYKLETGYGSMTCGLVALQYLEARELVNAKKEYLPLLASILYHPGKYSSDTAHQSAKTFQKLPAATLEAIAFNFICLNNFLFKKTHFSLLTAGKAKPENPMSIGATESLYNLSADGYGDINTVEQINIIQYLTLNRKKIIDSVRSMNDAKMKITDIAEHSGLPFHVINEILQ